MRNAQEIVDGLQAIVNAYSDFAVIWHVVLFVLILALVIQWRPSGKLLGSLLSIPLLSVAFFAWITGNPFNGTVFSILTLLVLIFGLRSSHAPVDVSPRIFALIGVVMVLFGFAYPHFVTGPVIRILYASPFGLIPCPTLSLLIGFMLVFNNFKSKPLSLVFIVSGLFYGLFGVLKLAVMIDLLLVFGAATLLVKYFIPVKQQ